MEFGIAFQLHRIPEDNGKVEQLMIGVCNGISVGVGVSVGVAVTLGVGVLVMVGVGVAVVLGDGMFVTDGITVGTLLIFKSNIWNSYGMSFLSNVVNLIVQVPAEKLEVLSVARILFETGAVVLINTFHVEGLRPAPISTLYLPE